MLCPLLRMSIGRESAVSSLPPSPQEDWKRYSPLLLCTSSALYCMLNWIFFWIFFWWSQVMVFLRVFFPFWTFIWRIFRGLRRWQSLVFQKKIANREKSEKEQLFGTEMCFFFLYPFLSSYDPADLSCNPFLGSWPLTLGTTCLNTAGTVLCILFSSIALSLWIILFFLSISPCLCLRCLT